MNKFLLRTKTAFFADDLDDDQIRVLTDGSGGVVDKDYEDYVEFKDGLINLHDISFINESNKDTLTLTMTNGEKYSVKKTKKILANLESFMLD